VTLRLAALVVPARDEEVELFLDVFAVGYVSTYAHAKATHARADTDGNSSRSMGVASGIGEHLSLLREDPHPSGRSLVGLIAGAVLRLTRLELFPPP
jgi:hypothetical protein